MPEELRKICTLFEKHNFTFCLFKCEHVLEGKNKNLDLLFLHETEYNYASKLLREQGFVLYLSEKVEKYKRMYLKFEKGIVTAVHLHREIAWHGVVILDKDLLFKRMKDNVPSVEDSLLIHAAHALFENFKVSELQKALLKKYRQEAKDWKYLNFQLEKKSWKKSFYRLLNNDFTVSKGNVFRAYYSRLWNDPFSVLSLMEKGMMAIVRKISLRRRGYLIALLGPNGAGKSTTKRKVLEIYEPLTNFARGQQGYYFGWKQSVIGRILSPLVNRSIKGKSVFEKVSEEKVKAFDLFQECLFVYIYGEYLFRYAFDIYPLLRKGKLIVCDRYFYDLNGQYPYSINSRILPLLPFPKPNQVFILDADIETLMKRDKTGESTRIVKSRKNLEGQREKYQKIGKKLKVIVLDNTKNFNKIEKKIVDSSWKKYVTGIQKA